MSRIVKQGLLPALMLCGLLALVGCEGDQGPVGAQGPEGPAGPPGPPGGTSEFTYAGYQGEACLHCHGRTVADVRTTGHNVAYAGLDAEDQDLPYCLQCHTTGWDTPIAYGVTEFEPTGDDVHGYDDYFGVDTTEAASRRDALENVQCESCHGAMGPDFNAHTPNVVFSTIVDGEITASCVPCHDGQLDEWVTSGHGTVSGLTNEEFVAEFGRTSCWACHTSEGFIAANDPVYASYDFGGDYNFIGCVTCHDPHVGEAGGGNEAQLRALGAVEVVYAPGLTPGDPEVPRMEGYGAAQTCAQCHHARRDATNVSGQINSGTSRFGPHGSPQMDMFIGAGSYEIPNYVYDREHSHQNIDDACVKCHMVREVLLHGELQDHSFHTFTPDVGNCAPCHTGIEDFDIGGLQTTIHGKLDQLAVLAGYADWATLEATIGADNPAMASWQREAIYAGVFVSNDGSHGVHNPEYALDLLDNAIAYYQSQLTQ